MTNARIPIHLVRTHWATTAAILVGCLIGFIALIYGSAPATVLGPALTLDATTVHLGNVWEQSHLQHTIRIKNNTNAPFAIRKLDASCGCTSVAPDDFVIPAREIASINLLLNLQGKGLDRTQPPGNAFELALTAYSPHQRGALFHWNVRGLVRSSIVLPNRGEVYLTRSYIRGFDTTWDKQEFIYPCAAEVAEVKVEPALPYIHTDSCIRTVTGRSEWLVAIVPLPQIPDGHIEIPCVVTPLTEAGTSLGSLQVTVHCHIASRFFAAPDTLHFTRVPPHSSVREPVVVQSRTTSRFRVDDVVTSSSKYTVTPTRSDVLQQSHRFVVASQPNESSSDGSHSLTFRLTDEEGANHTLDVPLIALVFKQAYPEACQVAVGEWRRAQGLARLGPVGSSSW